MALDFDTFLDKYVGQFGCYQLIYLLFIPLEECFIVFNLLSPVFLVGEPKHHCELPAVNLSNCTQEEFLHFAIPLDKDGQLSSCHMYQRNYSQVTDYDVCLKNQPLSTASNETSSPVPVVPCDSWVYDSSIFTKTMVTEWDLVCEYQYKASSVAAVYMAGYMVGSIVVGFLADCVGRKPVILVTGFIHVVAGVVVGFVPNLPSALAMRFIQAFCGAGKTTATFIVLTEMVGPDWRTFVMVVYYLYWVAGYVFMAGLAYVFRDWRTLELVITTPELIYLGIFIFFVPESPRWLLSKNRPAKAHVILQQMCKRNHKECPKEIKIYQSEKRIGTALDLVRTPGLRKSTFILIIGWFACGFVYYGLSLNTSNLGGSPYINFLIAGALELPAYLILIPLHRYCGRVCSFSVFMLSVGVLLMCVAAIPRDMVWLVVTVSMAGKFFIASAFLIIWFYTLELYPTEIRSIGLNYINTMARVAALLATYVVLLDKIHTALPPVVFGSLALVSSFATCGLAETKGAPLLQTTTQAEDFIQNCRRKSCWEPRQHVVETEEEEMKSVI